MSYRRRFGPLALAYLVRRMRITSTNAANGEKSISVIVITFNMIRMMHFCIILRTIRETVHRHLNASQIIFNVNVSILLCKDQKPGDESTNVL